MAQGFESSLRRRQDLGGTYTMYIEGQRVGEVAVPSSYPPVGTASLSREVTLDPKLGGRVFLILEGVASEAEVWWGSHYCGHMVGFSRYEFELTSWLSEQPTQLTVRIFDLHARFGNSPGWETYGGLIRPIYLESRPLVYLATPSVATRLTADHGGRIAATIDLMDGVGEDVRRVQAVLYDADGRPVADSPVSWGSERRGRLETTLELAESHWWEPDSPYCYRLQWTWASADEMDSTSVTVGLREFSAVGRQFYLNRRPIFLQGVCRHDLWRDQGYTLRLEQIRHDLEAIKALGCNFVRLVHYPHDARVLEVADEVGLLVTEEPGFWNDHLEDTHLEPAKAAALDVLQRMVLRDRTHPSLVAWLLGNESWADPGYLRQASAWCRTLDPDRLVGFSDLYAPRLGKKVAAKDAYEGWEPDFYDYHPYAEAANLYRDPPLHLNDKPLIYGEWGGFWVQHDDWLLDKLGQQFATWAQANEAAASQLAGFSFWQWADIRQYQRGYPGCESGVLTEGLVTEDRQPKPELERMRQLLAKIRDGQGRSHQAEFCLNAPVDSPTVASEIRWTPELITEQDQAWNIVDPDYGEWTMWPPGLFAAQTAPAPPWRSPKGRPVLVSLASPTVDSGPLGRVSDIVVVGLGDLSDGFPVAHAFGEPALRLTLWMADRSMSAYALCHGLEISRQNRLYWGSRINPLALNTARWFDWVADPDFDIRVVRAWVWHLPHSTPVDRVRLGLLDASCRVVIHGVYGWQRGATR